MTGYVSMQIETAVKRLRNCLNSPASARIENLGALQFALGTPW